MPNAIEKQQVPAWSAVHDHLDQGKQATHNHHSLSPPGNPTGEGAVLLDI
jgi:hypothetical protein